MSMTRDSLEFAAMEQHCHQRNEFAIYAAKNAVRKAKPEPTFECEGAVFTLAQMRASNADDEDVCGWLRTAAVGDYYPAINGCRRVA